jgi:hypothetical protein
LQIGRHSFAFLVEVNPSDLLKSGEKAPGSLNESPKGERVSKGKQNPSLNKTVVEDAVS